VVFPGKGNTVEGGREGGCVLVAIVVHHYMLRCLVVGELLSLTYVCTRLTCFAIIIHTTIAEGNMIIRVQYQNFQYDYVDAAALQKLIETKRIRQFFRPFVNQWVNVERGPIRRADITHSGPERRQLRVVAR
jgi:hypothetical protein